MATIQELYERARARKEAAAQSAAPAAPVATAPAPATQPGIQDLFLKAKTKRVLASTPKPRAAPAALQSPTKPVEHDIRDFTKLGTGIAGQTNIGPEPSVMHPTVPQIPEGQGAPVGLGVSAARGYIGAMGSMERLTKGAVSLLTAPTTAHIPGANKFVTEKIMRAMGPSVQEEAEARARGESSRYLGMRAMSPETAKAAISNRPSSLGGKVVEGAVGGALGAPPYLLAGLAAPAGVVGAVASMAAPEAMSSFGEVVRGERTPMSAVKSTAIAGATGLAAHGGGLMGGRYVGGVKGKLLGEVGGMTGAAQIARVAEGQPITGKSLAEDLASSAGLVGTMAVPGLLAGRKGGAKPTEPPKADVVPPGAAGEAKAASTPPPEPPPAEPEPVTAAETAATSNVTNDMRARLLSDSKFRRWTEETVVGSGVKDPQTGKPVTKKTIRRLGVKWLADQIVVGGKAEPETPAPEQVFVGKDATSLVLDKDTGRPRPATPEEMSHQKWKAAAPIKDVESADYRKPAEEKPAEPAPPPVEAPKSEPPAGLRIETVREPGIKGARYRVVDADGTVLSDKAFMHKAKQDLEGFQAKEAAAKSASLGPYDSGPRQRDDIDVEPASGDAPRGLQPPAPGGLAVPPVSSGSPHEGVLNIPTADIHVDAPRFQFKLGAGAKGTVRPVQDQPYSRASANAILVWRDPADQKTYVVDGHHRHARAVAHGVTHEAAIEIQAKTDKDARVVGALANIANDKGTDVDVGKLIRDAGLTPADLAEAGIAADSVLAKRGQALAKLHPSLFGAVATGDMSPDIGVEIGARIADHEKQFELVKLLGQEKRQPRPDVIAEIADSITQAPTEEGMPDIFGNRDQRTLAMERAKVTAEVKRLLGEQRTALGVVTKERKAGILESAGNVLDLKKSKEAKKAAENVLSRFDAEKNAAGSPVSAALNEAATAVAGGEHVSKAAARARETITKALRKADAAGKAASAPGSEEGRGAPESLLDRDDPKDAARIARDGPTPQESSEAGKVPLNVATMGLAGFIEHSAIPSATGALNAGASFLARARDVLFPTAFRDQRVLDSLHQMFGDKNAETYVMTVQETAMAKRWEKLKADRGLVTEFIDRIKSGQAHPDPADQMIAGHMRWLDERNWQIATQLGIPLAWLENHFRVFWKRGSNLSDADIARIFGSNRPIRGTGGMLKRHVYDLFSEGVNAGLEPVDWNPVRMHQMAQIDLWKLITAVRMFNEAKDQGWVKFSRSGPPKDASGKIDPEYTHKIDDKIAQVWFPAKSGEGLVKGGEYWATKDWADLFNNHVSRDYIRENGIGRGLIRAKHEMTAIELTASGFHWILEGAFTWEAKFASGVRRSINVPGERLAGVKEAATFWSAMPETFIRGKRALDLFAKDPNAALTNKDLKLLREFPEARRLTKLLFQGGMRPEQGDLWHKRSWDAMLDSFREGAQKGDPWGALIKGGARAPFALADVIARPLFEWYVPNLKYGVGLRQMALRLAERHNDIASGKVTELEIAREVVRGVDDPMGQMAYEPLFWKRSLKTAIQLMFRAPLFQLGSIRMAGRAGPEQAAEFYHAIKEKRAPRLEPGMASVFGVIFGTTILGNMASKLLSGKFAWEWDDGKDLKGVIKNSMYPHADPTNPEIRGRVPSYAPTWYHMLAHPEGYVKGILSALPSKGVQWWGNRNFYDEQIYDPHDPWETQVWDQVKFWMVTPFAVQSGKQYEKQGMDPVKAKALSLVLQSAPGYVIKTPFQRKMGDLYGERGYSLTKEQAHHRDLKKQVVELTRAGKPVPPEVVKELTPKGVEAARRSAREDPTVSSFVHLNVEEKLDAYPLADEKERALKDLKGRTLIQILQDSLNSQNRHYKLSDRARAKAKALGLGAPE